MVGAHKTALARRKNVRFHAGDALELDVAPGSADVVFSNWLLMYLGDAEVAKLAADTLSWVSRVIVAWPFLAYVRACVSLLKSWLFRNELLYSPTSETCLSFFGISDEVIL